MIWDLRSQIPNHGQGGRPQTLPEDTWSHSAYHPENGETTLDDWLDTYARHVPDHVEQMERVRQAWLKTDPPGL
jgi:hypothetical protein